MPSIKDQFGNYTPNLQSKTVASSFTMGPSLSGAGAPSGDPGFSFAGYTDTNTGNQYFWNGSVWTAVSGGGGGSGSVLSDDYGGVAPAVTPSGPAWAEDTSNRELWFYDGTTWRDTGIQLPP